MIKKLILMFFMLIALLVSLVFLYQNLPQEPIEMKASYIVPEVVAIIDYGLTPVFAENLRFNHNNISYFIEDECVEIRRNIMIEAFSIFSEKMNLISFYEMKTDADIQIGCSNDYIELGERLFVAGEGGPSLIINTSMFKTIEKGKISLYNDPQCDYPVVELHELLHVFGFDHSENPKSIMYNVSNCEQRITPDIIELINKLYSIEPLADAVIRDLTAIKKGRYLDFNISVLNEGLIEIDNISLAIIVNDKEIHVLDLGNIGIGYGRTLRATNIKLPSTNVKKVYFMVDNDNTIREFNEDNNFVEMTIESQ